jgi:hypothetical protein
MAAPKQFNAGFEPAVVNIRCPSCRKNGAFHGLQNISDANFFEPAIQNGRRVGLPFTYGVRVCPNPDCHEPLFVLLGLNSSVVRTFPAERIDFEPVGVPSRILASFEEALDCHANSCFRASALMVRRTLEEICADRGVHGGNLKQRIAALGEKIVVPRELLVAADELRLLGNDAAHMEAQVYDDVGKDEVSVAIELLKEMLKATYQLSSLVDRLKALKRP